MAVIVRGGSATSHAFREDETNPEVSLGLRFMLQQQWQHQLQVSDNCQQMLEEDEEESEAACSHAPFVVCV